MRLLRKETFPTKKLLSKVRPLGYHVKANFYISSGTNAGPLPQLPKHQMVPIHVGILQRKIPKKDLNQTSQGFFHFVWFWVLILFLFL